MKSAKTGPIVAEARLANGGRHLATYEVKIYDGQGTYIACAMIDRRGCRRPCPARAFRARAYAPSVRAVPLSVPDALSYADQRLLWLRVLYFLHRHADQLAKKNITRSNNASASRHNNSSRLYEKADYLALRELTLSWDLPKAWTSKAFIQNASVYVTGQNLFYVTGYTGTSPEPVLTNSDNNENLYGVDQGRYPTPRTVLFGLSVTF